MSQSSYCLVAHLLGHNRDTHGIVKIYTKSWTKPHLCCMLPRKLFFFSFYFQFNLLVNIPTGIVLVLIYTLWANPRASSSQKEHPKSHFLFNIITLMTMCCMIKVAHVISLFINHCSTSSICTPLKSSTFFHLQGPYRCLRE